MPEFYHHQHLWPQQHCVLTIALLGNRIGTGQSRFRPQNFCPSPQRFRPPHAPGPSRHCSHERRWVGSKSTRPCWFMGALKRLPGLIGGLGLHMGFVSLWDPGLRALDHDGKPMLGSCLKKSFLILAAWGFYAVSIEVELQRSCFGAASQGLSRYIGVHQDYIVHALQERLLDIMVHIPSQYCRLSHCRLRRRGLRNSSLPSTKPMA